MDEAGSKVPGYAKQLGTLVLGLDPYLKLVLLLPTGVDIDNLGACLGAAAERCDMTLGSGIEMLHDVFCHRLDPSSSPEGTASKSIMVATGPVKTVKGRKLSGIDWPGVDEAVQPLGDGRLTVLRMSPGSDAKDALRRLVKGPGLTICVDDDVEASDLRQVVWGMATRFQPADDFILQNGGLGVDGTKPEGWKAKRATLPFT
jgi:3-polyprenyl-4-hydroxybenzoate decarboxylase